MTDRHLSYRPGVFLRHLHSQRAFFPTRKNSVSPRLLLLLLFNVLILLLLLLLLHCVSLKLHAPGSVYFPGQCVIRSTKSFNMLQLLKTRSNLNYIITKIQLVPHIEHRWLSLIKQSANDIEENNERLL